MTAIWGQEPWSVHPPATRAVVLADRMPDLVGFFLTGLKPNGSTNLHALRRDDNHWLRPVVTR